MKRQAMLVVLVDDFDFTSESRIKGNNRDLRDLKRACVSAVLEADMVIHADTGRIYKSRYTVVPDREIDEDAVRSGVKTLTQLRREWRNRDA